MILQAAGLAVLAAISPTALLVAAVYLGSARPRLVGTLYLAGAIIMSLVMGLVVIAILRNTGLRAVPVSTRRATACGSASAWCCSRRLPCWPGGSRSRPTPTRSRGSCHG